MAATGVRIGELARRTGVSPELLRAWEQRYDLLQPARTDGGFRLYTVADESRVRRMTELIASGLSAAEAAQQATAAHERVELVQQPAATSALASVATSLLRALDGFDGTVAHAALDRLFATVSVEVAITDVLIPYLHELGERWSIGSATVAQEHFASNLIRGRLLALSRDWGMDAERTVVVACLPGEEHDLGLLIFSVLIARHGWRPTFLGANAPLDTVLLTVRLLQPQATVLCTLNADRVRENRPRIRAVAKQSALYLASPIDDKASTALGATPLPFDIVEAATTFGVPKPAA